MLPIALVLTLAPSPLPLLPALSPSPGPFAALAGAGEATSELPALETIETDEIRSDVYFIASDELGGRDTPSTGLRIAARFLRTRLERLGFSPAGDDGFFDRYGMTRLALDLEGTSATLVPKADGAEALDLVYGEHYYFPAKGFGDAERSGPVVFAGTGAGADVEGLELEGSWALVVDSLVSARRRSEALRERGAIGEIVLPLVVDGRSRADRYARRMKRRAGRGALRVDEDLLPNVRLTTAGAAALGLDHSTLAPGARLPMTFRDVRKAAEGAERIDVENVAGLWPGSDPELAQEVIVISAHYDHIGVEGDQVYNGADDNGSGTATLLALAEALAEHGPLRRSVLLLWVSGEEKGLMGSYAWTVDPTLPEGTRAVCNLNIDMVGRNAPDYLLITPSAEHPAHNDLVRVAQRNAPLEGFPELGSCDEYWRRSDHMNFAENLGIPVAFLFSDVHEDYHRPTDTPDKVDYDKVRRVTRLVFRMLVDLQGDELL